MIKGIILGKWWLQIDRNRFPKGMGHLHRRSRQAFREAATSLDLFLVCVFTEYFHSTS